jgi:hypothetical protein
MIFLTGNETIAFQIMSASFFKEDVGFVDEHDGVPFCGQVKSRRELFLDHIRTDAKVSRAYGIQRSLCIVRYTL